MSGKFTGALCAVLLSASAAWAQEACGPTEEIHKWLGEAFNERRHAQGINASGMLIEVWGNAETGTFTVLATTPDGVSCLVTDGSAFAAFPPEPNI